MDSDDSGGHRVTITPTVGPSWNGIRFQARASDGAIHVEPGNGLALGGGWRCASLDASP